MSHVRSRAVERVIEVRDLQPREDGARIFLDLADVLPIFDPDGFAWSWGVREMPELTADERWDLNLPVIEKAIANNPRGWVLSFDDLKGFASRVQQIIWGEFLAGPAPNALPRKVEAPPVAAAKATAGLLAFDSSYWLLGGPDATIEKALRTFQNTREVNVEDWPALD